MALQVRVALALFTGKPGPWAVVGILFVAFLPLGLLLAWFYALGTYLHCRLLATVPMSLNWFRMSALLPVAYVGLLLVYGWNAFRTGRTGEGLIALLSLLHLSSENSGNKRSCAHE